MPALNIDCLMIIFRFLPAATLCACARVCKLWSQLSRSPLLWQNVCLGDTRVVDWTPAAEYLRRTKCHTLDLRNILPLPNLQHGLLHTLPLLSPALTTLILPEMTEETVVDICAALPHCVQTLVLQSVGERVVVCKDRRAGRDRERQGWTAASGVLRGEIVSAVESQLSEPQSGHTGCYISEDFFIAEGRCSTTPKRKKKLDGKSSCMLVDEMVCTNESPCGFMDIMDDGNGGDRASAMTGKKRKCAPSSSPTIFRDPAPSHADLTPVGFGCRSLMHLTLLRTLSIRSYCGIALPAFSFQ